MSNDNSLVSVIVPCYNESENIVPFWDQLRPIMERYAGRFEVIFVDDGSRDQTVDEVRNLSQRDTRVKLIELARNFGKEIAVTAGLHHVKGEAAITMDADLQHPPAVIPELLRHWNDGADVVVGVRGNTDGASWVKRTTSSWFYKIFRIVSDTSVMPGSTDFRLLDRAVVDEFNRFTERRRLTRGLIDWLGFTHAYVPFNAAQRFRGEAKYSYRKLIGLAVNSFVSMSLLPLRLAGYMGAVIMLLSGIVGAAIFIEHYILHDPMQLDISGTAQLAVILIFLVGVILGSLGLIALYIANIHTEVINRPLYVLRRVDRPRPKRRRGTDTTEADMPDDDDNTPAAARRQRQRTYRTRREVAASDV